MAVPSWAIPYIEKLKCIWMKANNEDNFRDFTDVPVKNGAYGERFFWNNRENYSYSHILTSSSYVFLPMVKFDVTITFENDKYVYRTSSYTPVTSGVVGYNNTSFRSFYPQNFDSNGIWIGNGQGRNPDVPSSNQFDTLSDCIIYISENFTNIGSLTVLGEDWTNPTPSYTSNGGGATHIAKVTGQLKDLSSNLSDILMVSGGGGGGLLVGETEYTGKEAGGISGSGDNSADQSTGNAFGLGESGTNLSGGGSGLYGGYKGTSSKSGGAGSGYIRNSLLSNKKMVGYNVPTSSAENTKTESVNEASADPVSDKPKIGNGFARIKFLRDS